MEIWGEESWGGKPGKERCIDGAHRRGDHMWPAAANPTKSKTRIRPARARRNEVETP